MSMPPLPPPEVVCVAEAVYHEARSVTMQDKLKVGELVWNRSRDKKKSPCVITHMKGQFPWASSYKQIHEYTAWSESLEVARRTRYRVSKVRYMVNTWAHRPQKDIHVLYRDKDLLFYNRYKDQLWKSECDYQIQSKHILPMCR